MRRLATFVWIGLLFAAAEEFLTVVLLKGEIGSYIVALLVLFPAFLLAVYGFSALLERLIEHAGRRDLGHFLASGMLGLAIEWFLIGLSPWNNPEANPLLMLLFQLGMFSFWATVGFAPRLLLSPSPAARNTGNLLARCYFSGAALIAFVCVVINREWRFGVSISAIVLGLLALNIIYVGYFRRCMAAAAPQ